MKVKDAFVIIAKENSTTPAKFWASVQFQDHLGSAELYREHEAEELAARIRISHIDYEYVVAIPVVLEINAQAILRQAIHERIFQQDEI